MASPAWYDEFVLSVGSVGPDGRPSAFTLAGPWVDVAAPGEAVVSLGAVGDATVQVSGTSYAAPTVSAVAALVRARFPELTARQVMRRIEDTAMGGAEWNAETGHGVVDALAAVSGGSPPRPASSRAPVDAGPAGASPDPSPRRDAMRAAAACVALSIAVAAVSSRRSRRRTESVTAD